MHCYGFRELITGVQPVNDKQLRQIIMTRLTVPLWPHAGKALGISRSTAYARARTGEIVTLGGPRQKQPVPTAFLRKKLGLNDDGSQAV
jgi:hypothetical protein